MLHPEPLYHGKNEGAGAMKKKIPAGHIKLKRTYDAAAPDDGTRILVDRLWPRGVRKSDAAIDQWLKDLAPSTELRQWFKHDPALWPEFRSRYAEELHQHPALLEQLRELARHGTITLLYSAHDAVHNDAIALRALLLGSHPET
jgi:uncharacterized protein YeaO (DUF488 family)